jgi:hypothetical protein
MTLDAVERRWDQGERAIARAEWRLYIGRPGADGASRQRTRNAWLSDPELLPSVRLAARRTAFAPLAQRLRIFGRLVAEAQIEQHPSIVRLRSSAQRRIVAFRPRWKGKPVDPAVPEEVLHHSPRRTDRRAAYYADEPLFRPLVPALQRLVERRNDRARERGFRSFPEYRLAAEGLTVARLYDLLDAALVGAPRRLRRIRERFQERTGEAGWYPWDLEYARESGIPDRCFPAERMLSDVRDGVRGWGFRPEQLKFRLDWHETPSGGMEISVDPPRDVRVIATARPGWTYRGVLFHEVGHAIHARSIRASTPWTRRPASLPGFASLCEGLGAVFESIPASREWLAAQRDLPPEVVQHAVDGRSESDLVWMVYHANRVRSEIEMYTAPERDPTAGPLRFLRSMYGFDRFRPLSPANSFTLDTPLYLPSYVLAALFSRQVEESMLSDVGGAFWPNRRIGPWLTEHWFRDGARHDWIPRVRAITGRPFGPAAFRRSVGLG